MGLFSSSYEPGGVHHVRITDSVFHEAQEIIANDDEVRKHFKKIATDSGCAEYEANDFPVAAIIGTFYLSYQLQEEKNGVPENLRIGNIQLGRKDLVEYDKFVKKFNERIDSKYKKKYQMQHIGDGYGLAGVGAALAMKVRNAAIEGVTKAATGKSEDMREFEKDFVTYICGDSKNATEYILKFATEFGASDDGVVAVAKTIREQFWMSEFAKNNRSGK